MWLNRVASRITGTSGNLMMDKSNQLFFMLLVVMFSYSIVFSILDYNLTYYASAIANLCMLPATLISAFLLKKKYVRTAKIVAILFADFVITNHCIAYSPASFVCSFYFPVIMCSLVVLQGKDRFIGYTLAALALTLLFAMLFAEHPAGLYDFTEEELEAQWLMNSIGAAILTLLVTIFILNVNQEIQNELSHQTEDVTQKNERLELNIRTKNRLFSIISHDLRNPLITIRGAFDMLNNSELPDEKKKQLMLQLGKRVDNTMVLMDNLLMWSRTQLDGIIYQPEILDPNHVIKGVVKQLEAQAEEKKILIIQQCPATVLVNADKNMIELIFRNLISNAIKFTHPEGYVKITIERHGKKAHLVVSDSGVGMSAEVIHKLRNKEFFSNPGTRKEKGTGLGLLLCHEFVARHKGELIIDSQPGAGSVITVVLDAVDDE